MTTKKHGALDYNRSDEEELTFAEEAALAQTALAIADLLISTDTTQRTLAERVKVSEGRISQILRADSNPTLKTLARIGHAMGRRITVEFRPHQPALAEARPWAVRLSAPPPARWKRTNDDVEDASNVSVAA
jgi:transcriptional regulator with XRE-family HTH domain